MGTQTNEIKTYIKKLVSRYHYSFIPLRLKVDGNIQSGKIPAIADWSQYADDLPIDSDIDAWNIYGTPSGVGIVCGEASNLCCVDIDSNDPELTRRLMAIMPPTARILGRPGRGGKFLFRLREFPNDDIVAVSTKAGFNDGAGKQVVEIFVSKCQIAVPPSVHSILEDGEEIYYKWADDAYKSGEYPVADDLPVLTDHILTAIKQTISGLTPSEIAYSVPVGTLDLDGEQGMRYLYMQKRIGQLQGQRVGLDEAIRTLVAEDLKRHGAHNMMAMTKLAYTPSPALNILRMYTDMLLSHNKARTLDECEVPITLLDTNEAVTKDYSEWGPPLMPDDERPLIAPFDLSVVPEQWRELVRSVAEANSVPPEACLFILLTQLSAIIGNKRVIQGKMQNKEWNEAHNIWTIYVSRSGTRKTQLLRILSEPMKKLQKRINDGHRQKEREAQKLNEIIEPQIKELEARLKKEAVEALGNPHNKEQMLDLQMQIEALKKSVEVLPRKQLIVRSATTERLIEIIAENQTGVMLVFNELSELMDQFAKRGFETHKKLLMNSWDGLDPISHQTKTSGEIFAETACTALYGAIQQSLFMKEMIEIYHGKNDDGFWQRSFIVFNENDDVLKAIDEEFDHARHHKAYEIFYKAYDLEKSDEKIRTSYPAYEELMEFEDRVLTMIHGERVDAIGSFWGKFTGKVVKVASLLEFVKNDGEFPKEISLQSLREAIYIMDRQMTHIRRIFPRDGIVGLDEVVDLIRSGIINTGMTIRDLTRQHKKYFGNKDSKNTLLRELERRNIIRVEKQGHSLAIRVSPHVF